MDATEPTAIIIQGVGVHGRAWTQIDELAAKYE